MALVIFLLAFVLRLLAQIALGAYLHPETWEYEEIARNILGGRGFAYASLGTTYMSSTSSPLYIFLTVGTYALTGGSQQAMLLIQAALGGSCAAIAALIGQRLFGSLAGWATGGLVALHPGLLVYAGKLHALTLDAFLFVLVVFLCLWLRHRGGARQVALVGGTIGLAALSRSTVLFVLPAVAIWMRCYRAIPMLSRQAVVLILAAVVLVVPWSVRNSLLLGKPVAMSSESTEWLWRGNNPAATGSSWTADGQLMLDVAPAEFRARILGANEAERMDLYRDAAFAFILADPPRAAGLYVHKLGAFWWASGSTGIAYPGTWLLLYQAWYVGAILLAALGCAAGLRDPQSRPGVLLIVAVALSVSMAQSLFYVEGRHRWGVEPLLLVLTGAGLAYLIERLSAMKRRAPRRTWANS